MRKRILAIALAASLLSAAPAFSGVQILPKPTNDDFLNATPISSLPFDQDAHVEGSSGEIGEPNGCFGGSETIWYRYQSEVGTDVFVTAKPSSGGSTWLGIYRGDSLQTLTLVACGDSGYYHQGFYAEAGKTYYIQIPADFPNSAGVSVGVGGVGTVASTKDDIVHVHAEQGGGLAGKLIDSVSGQPVGGICVHTSRITGAYSSDFHFEVASAQDGSYRLSVPAGNYKIFFNDFCPRRSAYFYRYFGGNGSYESSTLFTVSSGSYQGGLDQPLTRGARILGTVVGPDGAPDAWEYVAAYPTTGGYPRSSQIQPDGTYVIGPLGAGSYKVLFSGDDSGKYQPSWYDNKSDFASADVVNLALGDDFRADAVLQELPPAPNDLIRDAVDASSLPFAHGSTLNKTGIEPGEPLACPGPVYPLTQTIWYRFESDSQVRLTAQAVGINANTPTLAIYASPSVAGSGHPLVPLACSWRPFPYYADIDANLDFTAQPGVVYYFQIGRTALPGTAGGRVRFTLSREDAPSNDLRANATPITSLPYNSGPFTTFKASGGADDGVPTCAGASIYLAESTAKSLHTVWFVYTAPSSGWIRAMNTTNWTETGLTVFRDLRKGTGIGALDLEEVACTENRNPADFEVVEGESYFFQISSPYASLNYRPEHNLVLEAY